MTASPGPGSLLGGRYRLDQRVGRGGMADVYRAHDELLHRIVAIKLFRPGAAEEQDRARFDAEMRTVAGLRHPGLVTLYDAGAGEASTDDEPYFVMEFVDGRTLRERLLDGPLPAPVAARLGSQLADTLAHVHARGIVHRDVKPANVLIDTSSGVDTARLTDFGIAQLADGAQLTAHGTTVGTANYVSPEQALGHKLGPASDVYSLGLVLLEMLTGRLAYPGSGIEAAVARLHRPPDIPPTLGPAWGSLLAAMTSRDPAQRPAAAQVREALDALAGTARPTAPLPAPTELPPPGATQLLPAAAERRRRRGPLVALLAAIAVAAGVLVAVLATSGGSGPTPTAAAVSYPAVSGVLGSDLQMLETQVAATPTSERQLRADTLALAQALAAGRDPSAALAALDDAVRSGSLSAAQRAGLQATIAAIRADLAAAAASSQAAVSSSAAALQAARSRSAAASASAAAAAAASRSAAAAASRSAAASAAAAAASRAAATSARAPAGPGPGPGHGKKTKPGKP